MTQKSESFRRVESLYQAALDEPQDQRLDFIRRESLGDDALLREVEALLQCYEAAKDDFLHTPAHGLTAPADHALALPQRIGRYRILEKLGEGGMGVVYRAEQENPKRQVALKAIRLGVLHADSFRRFELEAAILGRLKHPGIAQIYEAGMDDGPGGPRPYFAMELVDGPPLMAFAKQHGLETKARLELFAAISDAVQYAHQKGVIHRDLKPGNILIVDEATERLSDEATKGEEATDRSEPRTNIALSSWLSAQPKILDFGVARVTDSDIKATTIHTGIGQVVGTLPYMSPEQVMGNLNEIDTRSDVYALGVILYELLTGRLPFDVADKTIAAAARTISEEDPEPLSTIDRKFRGDLNTIVLKALEKEPQRRYPSASGMAADLRRYLRDEPISARPASAFYTFRKFARRNKATVMGVVAVFVVLIGGLIGTSYGLAQAVRAREAETEHRKSAEESEKTAIAARDEAQAVTEFLTDMLRAVNSEVGRADITVREVLDRAAVTLDEKFVGKPLVQARVRYAMSLSYTGLGLFDQAQAHMAEAAALFRREKGERDRETLWAMSVLADAFSSTGEFTKGEAQARATLEVQRRVFGEEHGDTLLTMGNLARSLVDQGRYVEAESLLRKLLQVHSRRFGEEYSATLITMNTLGIALLYQGRYAEAEQLHRKSLEIERRVQGEDHALTLTTMHNIAIAMNFQGRLAEAEDLHRRTLAARRRLMGEEHIHTLFSMDDLAKNLCDQHRFAEAEALSRKVLELLRPGLGEQHPSTLETMQNVVTALSGQGRFVEAESLNRTALDACRRVLGIAHPQTLLSMTRLAGILFEVGGIEEGESVYRGVIAAYRARTQKNDAAAADFQAYASLLLSCKTPGLCDPPAALEAAKRAVELTPALDFEKLDTLARAYHATGQTDEAIEAERRALSLLPPEPSPVRTELEGRLGEYLQAESLR